VAQLRSTGAEIDALAFAAGLKPGFESPEFQFTSFGWA
jgi:hypothetical protein